MIPLESAKAILSDGLLPILNNHASTLTVCGSVRRNKRYVNDIDIVMIEKNNYHFGEPTLSDTIKRLDPNGPAEAKSLGTHSSGRYLDGKSIKRFKYQGVMIDLYLANDMNYSCLVLIRTGSANHNIKLTTKAIEKGLRLFAGGEGLCTFTMKGDKAIPRDVVQLTEEGILKHLLGFVPKPEEREV